MTKRELIRKLESKGEYQAAAELRAHNSPLDEAINNITDLPVAVVSAATGIVGATVDTAVSVVNVFNPFKW